MVCKYSEEMKLLVSENPLLLTFMLTYIDHFKVSYKSLSLSNQKKEKDLVISNKNKIHLNFWLK